MRAWYAGVAALALASAAHAQAAQERVTLVDGTVMQGELVEKVPGDHVTIKLATGEVRTIQWRALAPQAPPPQPQGGLGAQPATAAPQGPTTHIEMDADRPGVALLRITSFGVVNAYTAYGSATGGFM
ncbi:MAG TPA: hypothetical protein VLM85_11505, partial [Polyangiaceae bacterium]|nr:hypothetical protein [Polyangiaceae bacterium]